MNETKEITQDLRAYLEVFSEEVREELADIAFYCAELTKICEDFEAKKLSAKYFYDHLRGRQVLLTLDAASVVGCIADKVLAVVEFGELGLVDEVLLASQSEAEERAEVEKAKAGSGKRKLLSVVPSRSKKGDN